MQSCPVTNGGWGSWTSWTSCTSSCNGGLQSRQRHCNNPKPSADGDFCDGSPIDTRLCNQQHCPRTKAAFLAESGVILSNGSVQFSTVRLSEGSVYDSSSGMFTCNIPGLYFFIANINENGNDDNRVYCYIKKNGYNYVSMYSRQGKLDSKYVTDGYGPVTGAATLHLLKGDHVHVQCDSNSGTSLHYSSFSGFFISADP